MKWNDGTGCQRVKPLLSRDRWATHRGEEQGADAVVLGGALHVRGQLVQHLDRERVELPGPVQLQLEHAIRVERRHDMSLRRGRHSTAGRR